MPRSRTLTRAAIATAALAVLDRGGLAALSMRAVASELGMSAMALYRYVDDREQLEKCIVEHLLDPIDLRLPVELSWKDQIEALMDRLRSAIGAHSAAVPLLLAHRHQSLASLRWIEAMLDVLAEAGLTGKDRAIAQRSLVSYLLGSLTNQHLGSLSGSGTAAMAALSNTEFPRVAEAARTARLITPDEEFQRGLAVFLHGLKILGTSG
ncbi:TetR/AcrR family transcriptional regulator [Mycolicibacterium sp. XJ870]